MQVLVLRSCFLERANFLINGDRIQVVEGDSKPDSKCRCNLDEKVGKRHDLGIDYRNRSELRSHDVKYGGIDADVCLAVNCSTC